MVKVRNGWVMKYSGRCCVVRTWFRGLLQYAKCSSGEGAQYDPIPWGGGCCVDVLLLRRGVSDGCVLSSLVIILVDVGVCFWPAEYLVVCDVSYSDVCSVMWI